MFQQLARTTSTSLVGRGGCTVMCSLLIFFLFQLVSKYNGVWPCASSFGGGMGNDIKTEIESMTSDNEQTNEEVSSKEKESKKEKEQEKMFSDWEWFDGDINAYYNNLEKEVRNRDPTKISSYAVHRGIGHPRSTEEHYKILDTTLARHHESYEVTGDGETTLQVLDAGCGLGSSLMWMEQHHSTWNLTGHTISDYQYQFIQEKLPPHTFTTNLKSYDDLDHHYDFIYSIEALIHSQNVANTLFEWSQHLNEGGVVAIIDDFRAAGTVKTDRDVMGFGRAWMAKSVTSVGQIGTVGRKVGLKLVEVRDLGEEYRVNELNYRFQVPEIKRDAGRNHQSWVGSKLRQRLMVQGKINYSLVVFKKQTPSG